MMNDDDILWENGYQGILAFKVSAHVKNKLQRYLQIHSETRHKYSIGIK